jgi:hypothetical protein
VFESAIYIEVPILYVIAFIIEKLRQDVL